MAAPFIKAINENLPEIDIVFDRFHLMQRINKAMDEVRKGVYRSMSKSDRTNIKGARFLLLKTESKLDPECVETLQRILAENEALMVMHMMKEELRKLWDCSTRSEAAEFLSFWCCIAMNIDGSSWTDSNDLLQPLKQLGLSMLQHWDGILTYFEHPISNGKAEGINNKIKTLKRQAYGYRDLGYFKLRLYHLHRQKHRFCG